MRIGVLDDNDNVINVILVDSEADLAALGITLYRVMAEDEGSDIYEPPAKREIRIKAEIEAIERADMMNRRAREAFMLQAEAIAADQYGLTPEQLYQVNPGYKGAKDVDDKVKALRALL
jgi:hypothetical protein